MSKLEKIKQVYYPCGCWFKFDIQNKANWKQVDFLICDEHIVEVLDIETRE